jgi:purine-nucleoside phosphorylase
MSKPTADVLETVLACWPAPPRVAIVLGTGFAAALPDWPVEARIAYNELPGFPSCTVAGHAGELLAVKTTAGILAVFAGRLHAYEGHSPADVVFPVDLAAGLGARTILLTCAAGGIRDDLRRGRLALVADHLNLAGWAPPTGREPFLDLSAVYDRPLQALASQSAIRDGWELPAGVLACVRGPAYETPAEVRMLAGLGADMVCMSTVPEAVRARALGLRVLGLACIANRAAGLAADPLQHRDVLGTVSRTVEEKAAWLLAVCGQAATAEPPSGV